MTLAQLEEQVVAIQEVMASLEDGRLEERSSSRRCSIWRFRGRSSRSTG